MVVTLNLCLISDGTRVSRRWIEYLYVIVTVYAINYGVKWVDGLLMRSLTLHATYNRDGAVFVCSFAF